MTEEEQENAKEKYTVNKNGIFINLNSLKNCYKLYFLIKKIIIVKNKKFNY